MLPPRFVAVLGLALSVSAQGVDPRTLNPHPTCVAIKNAVSSASAVFYYGTLGYVADNKHYMASSSQDSLCSVEPGTAQDVATIVCFAPQSK